MYNSILHHVMDNVDPHISFLNISSLARVLRDQIVPAFDEDEMNRLFLAATADPSQYWTGAEQTDLNRLPHETPETPEAECVICMSEGDTEDSWTTLPCQHVFHRQCVVTWLEMNNSCPCCRQTISSTPPEINNDS